LGGLIRSAAVAANSFISVKIFSFSKNFQDKKMKGQQKLWQKIIKILIIFLFNSYHPIWASRLLAARPARQLEEPLAGLATKQIDLNITVIKWENIIIF
jgi:hypothetical protein